MYDNSMQNIYIMLFGVLLLLLFFKWGNGVCGSMFFETLGKFQKSEMPFSRPGKFGKIDI